MAFHGIAEIRNHVAGDGNVDACPNGAQSAKDMECVMLETSKGASRKQEIDDDALGHRVRAGYAPKLADATEKRPCAVLPSHRATRAKFRCPRVRVQDGMRRGRMRPKGRRPEGR